MGSLSDDSILDALIVGAGFNGVYQLKHLRDNGYNVKLVDAASDYGGVWYWNRYWGARVDTSVPHYQFSDPELWKDWHWKLRYPDHHELRAYFAYVADKWDLRKDTDFNTFISKAEFDEQNNIWHMTSPSGKQYRAHYLLLSTGFAAKRHFPDWKGIDKFKGTWIHASYWPKEEPDLRGKKVAVIGSGSTAVQLSQEFSKVAGEFVLFLRTPNFALPMGQVDYTKNPDRLDVRRENYPEFFASRVNSFGGFSYSFLNKATFDDSPEKRKQTFQELWDHGDFHYWVGTYSDTFFNDAANKEAYNFWKEKTRPRIKDPRARDILAPEVQPHPFGCKQTSLENGFFEVFDQPNVSLVDLKQTPVTEVTEHGIKTTEKEWDFDFVVCATGFDALTGNLLQLDIRGKGGETLPKKWKDGTSTYLGMTVSDFPNMIFAYGPQAPTALCNGPTCAEYQGNFIVDFLNYMRSHNLHRFDAKAEAEQEWVEGVNKIGSSSLLMKAKSVSCSFYSSKHIH